MNGYLHYQHFKNLEYRFQFDVNNMLVMNTKESLDYPFYGTVYGTGNATIAGNAADGVNIDVAMTTNRNTCLLYTSDRLPFFVLLQAHLPARPKSSIVPQQRHGRYPPPLNKRIYQLF